MKDTNEPALVAKPNRILLDTNVWRYLVDADAAGDLIQYARSSPHKILVSPAVVYETLNLKDLRLMQSILSLMMNRRFVRLMPEAYSECQEILSEIRRIRPEWIREEPDLAFFDRLYKDWSRRTGGFWVRCERSPQAEAERIAKEEPFRTRARVQTEEARKEMILSGWKKNPPMNKTLAGFRHPMPGWQGDMVEAWRLDSWAGATYALGRPGNAYRDWIAPFVDVDSGLLFSSLWLEFWLYEVKTGLLPRQWLRWAHSFCQRFRKVTPGSPGDTQLNSYFFEADVVITADKAMISILNEYRPYAPCLLPLGYVMPAGTAGVSLLFEQLLV